MKPILNSLAWIPSVTSGGKVAPSLRTGRLVRMKGKMNEAKYREILDENLLQRTQDLRLGQRFTFQQDNEPKHTAKITQEKLWDKSLNVLEWPSQISDLNPIKHLWWDLKIAVQPRFPFNLTELETIYREEWEKLSKYRCAKLVASYPRRKYTVKSLNTCVNVEFYYL